MEFETEEETLQRLVRDNHTAEVRIRNASVEDGTCCYRGDLIIEALSQATATALGEGIQIGYGRAMLDSIEAQPRTLRRRVR